MPEPWATLLAGLIGPYGVVVLLAVVVFFLWRLFREEQSENKKNFLTVSTAAKAVEILSEEVKEWREAGLASFRGPTDEHR